MYISIEGLPPDKGKQYNTQKSIKIRLTGTISTQAEINPFDQIKTLFDTVKNPKYRFIYNGMFLNPSLSFAFYGVTDEDLIYVVKPKKPELVSIATQTIPDFTIQLRSHFQKHWAHKLSDPDAFQSFKDAADPITARESARLNDLHRSKIEASAPGFRKLCRKFERLQIEQIKRKGEKENF